MFPVARAGFDSPCYTIPGIRLFPIHNHAKHASLYCSTRGPNAVLTLSSALKSSRCSYYQSMCKKSVKELIETLQKFCYFLGILQLLPTESGKSTASCIGFHIDTEWYDKMAAW